MEEASARRKRINRLKKMILGGIVIAILFPVITCVILGVRVVVLSNKIEELQVLLLEEQNKQKEVTGVFSTAHVEESKREPEPEVLSKEEESSAEPEFDKSVYLTFDDGPSSNTNAILDILKEYDVKATFFVVGKTDEASKEAYRRIVAEGHTLGMHSYSHKYDEIYQSKESFTEDLFRLQEYLYEVTGVWSRYYRFPGGSSNTVSKVDMQELIAWMNESGIIYYDWNTASGDAVSRQLPKDTIVENCLENLDRQSECMILMHDAADKQTTVEALPEIIAKIRLRGDACFLPITDETKPVQHVKAQINEGN